MKKLTFLLLLCLSSVSHAAKIAVTVSDGSLQAGTTAGFNVSSGTSQNLNATTSFQSTNLTIIGTSLITGATCAASSATGGLTIGTTYYWKVYAIPDIGNGSVGSQSGLRSMTMVANSGQRSGLLSWNSVTGANHYAITRHSGLTGPDGVVISTITNTVFLDTGVTTTAGNPWPAGVPYASTGSYFSSGILMNGNMPIVWNDYATGTPIPYMGPTSAGEWVIRSGTGVSKNNFYLNDINDRAYWRLSRDPNDGASVINGQNAQGTDNPVKLISGSSMTIIMDNNTTMAFRSSATTVMADFEIMSSSKIYWAAAGGVSTGTRTGFNVSNSSQVNVSINGFNLYSFLRGQLSPGEDAVENLGSGSARWNTVFASVGTINTSSSKYKKNIVPIDPLKTEVPQGVTYQWKEPKGLDRPYMGFLADGLPRNAFDFKPDGTIDDKSVYENAVIGILCSHVRQLEKEVRELKKELRRRDK